MGLVPARSGEPCAMPQWISWSRGMMENQRRDVVEFMQSATI
jgi:hypothetical protein